MPGLTDRRLLAAALVGWLAVAVLSVVFGPPLGHDESAFAILARGDGPPWLYRSRGVVAIAELGVMLGGADWAIRLGVIPFGAGLVLAVYALGRAAFGPRTDGRPSVGAWAAAVVAGAHPMALRSAELIGDLPATACIVAGLAVVVGELRRDDGPRMRLVLAAPLVATAFYFRHASVSVIAVAGAAAAIVWWRSIIARPSPVLATAACIAALLAPHVVYSIDETGSWRGILDLSRGMPRRAYIGEGLVTYLTSNPLMFYGFLVAPLAVVGLATFWRLGRVARFLAIVAIGQLVLIGLTSHGQPRYVFVSVAVLVVVGVAGIVEHAVARPRVALAVVALAWLGVVVAVVPYHRDVARTRAPIVAAAETIRAHVNGGRCIVAARVVPQLMWYARCDGFLVGAVESIPPEAYVVSLPLYPIVDGRPELPSRDGARVFVAP